MLRHLFHLLILLATITTGYAQLQLPQGISRLDITLGGVPRTGFIYTPTTARETPAPVIFVWHGHGGTALNAARSFAMHRHMPEAISVYLQGLNTPGQLTDPEGKKPGWQHAAGAQDDRDLKLFDAALAYLKEHYKVDTRRIFSTGHSNGGGFTYLLWQTRPDVLCAVAPSAAASIRLRDTPFKPKPCMHLAGTADPLVKFEWQQQAIARVKEINQCEPEGKPWAPNCTLYPSKAGTPLITFILPGGTHKFPEEAPPLIARFFKEQAAAVK
ncbi:alpha/beta hydrolase family esterase [Prosthecobacter fluviatilis]|uniref:Alpha/beta hydrolase family esterase n=1 Tax=Prosthecobacter fluviatilis TaxID=445931 RepID=A0ABW0KQ07_9BACT